MFAVDGSDILPTYLFSILHFVLARNSTLSITPMDSALSKPDVYENATKNHADVEAAAVHIELQDVYGGEESIVDPIYRAKDRILTQAFQEIGMGKYQVCDCNIMLSIYPWKVMTSCGWIDTSRRSKT